MRALPPFTPIVAMLTGLLVATLSVVALPGEWLAFASPRAGAEDAVAQAEILPFRRAVPWATSGLDEGCPLRAARGWRWLVHHDGAQESFSWLLQYTASPTGRLLALAGLAAVDTASYRRALAAFDPATALPDSVPVFVGWAEQDDHAPPVVHLTRSAALSAVATGALTRDLLQLVPAGRRCYPFTG
jgi:hypothetical protein